MYETALSIISDYIKTYLFIPRSNWPKREFMFRSYSRYAAYEIINRIAEEDMRLPEYITGKERKTPSTIVNEFIFEMEYFYEISNECMCAIAKDTAKDIMHLITQK